VARALNAKAFTYGTDIGFRRGAYRPETPAGKRLLAHELTHSLQQSRGTDHASTYANRVIQPYRPKGAPNFGAGDSASLKERSFGELSTAQDSAGTLQKSDLPIIDDITVTFTEKRKRVVNTSRPGT
jgi:hypothetical protein